MAEYTYEDIIIDPTSDRAKEAVGKECYFGDNPTSCLNNANKNSNPKILTEIPDNGYFRFKSKNMYWGCIIVKKEEPKPKYVPFENITEFLDAYRSTLGSLPDEVSYLSNNGIWLNDMETDAYCMVTEIWNYGVVVGDSKMNTTKDGNKYFTINGVTTWEELLMEYTFIDDSPCGKIAEEEQ